MRERTALSATLGYQLVQYPYDVGSFDLVDWPIIEAGEFLKDSFAPLPVSRAQLGIKLDKLRDDLGEGKGVNLLFLRFVLVELA